MKDYETQKAKDMCLHFRTRLPLESISHIFSSLVDNASIPINGEEEKPNEHGFTEEEDEQNDSDIEESAL